MHSSLQGICMLGQRVCIDEHTANRCVLQTQLRTITVTITLAGNAVVNKIFHTLLLHCAGPICCGLSERGSGVQLSWRVPHWP